MATFDAVLYYAVLFTGASALALIPFRIVDAIERPPKAKGGGRRA